MLLPRTIKKVVHNNLYLIFGIVLGISISFYFDDLCEVEEMQTKSTPNDRIVNTESYKAQEISTRRIKLIKRLNVTKKEPDKLIRPRYYSTELGIREKLFVGILTAEDRIDSQAVYINKTITHVVDKVKFFITARNKMKSTVNLTGIVGFTDTRQRYRPFQVIKYIGDTFIQDYDYYFLMNDYDYLNIRKLKQIVAKISVGMHIYLGKAASDGSFCDLDAGILFSNSVIRGMKANLDWCITNAISDDNGENLGRCVHHSFNLECQEEIQGQSIPSFKLKHFQLEKYLEQLIRREEFRKAVTVYPILQPKYFYLLNAYFSRQRLEKLNSQIKELSKNLNDSWPPGQRIGAKPATRFDLPLQLYFNMTHMFFPDDFTNIRQHTKADYLDIQKIIEAIKSKFLHERSNDLQYRRLVNGYRTFDLSRGMDYLIDLGFRDLNTGKEVIKRFEVCKPLGKVEFIPAPYVTENTRITILLLVQEHELELALNFINNYNQVVMERKEKTMLMLILIYQFNSSSKGIADIFSKLKQLAVELSNKYRNDERKIVWVSIRLPFANKMVTLDEHRVLHFAIIDLALKKVGLESLTLVLDVYVDISVDFLNRVRMNTITNFQIFSPIPFRQYDPKVTRNDVLELNKNVGHFDREEYKYISFYGKDYVFARKRAQLQVPIIRTDNDIVQLLNNTNDGNVFDLFVRFSDNLHCMRATEKDLRIKYHEMVYGSDRTNLFLGTKIQLAKLLLSYQSKIGITF